MRPFNGEKALLGKRGNDARMILFFQAQKTAIIEILAAFIAGGWLF